MATGGLTVAVMLCLVAAISLLNSTPPEETATVKQTSLPQRPIEVASTGEVSHLLNEHPTKPVPEPVDHLSPGERVVLPEQFASTQPELSQQWTPRPDGDEPHYEEIPSLPDSEPNSIAANTSSHTVQIPIPTNNLESDIAQLKGQVNELARSQLEAQLAEIRHTGQLLSTHQTQRMIETLQRDVDELKRERAVLALGSESTPEVAEVGRKPTLPPIDNESPWNAVGEAHEPVQSPDVAASVDASRPSTETGALPKPTTVSRVRFTESATLAGRFDVDADQASLEEFLATLGPVAGWNLVNGPELTGSVTCRWKGVELQQALVQLLRVHGRQIRQDGDFAIVEALPSRGSAKPHDSASASGDDQESEGPITLELSPDLSGTPPASQAEYSTTSSPLRIREVHGVRAQFPMGADSAATHPLNSNDPPGSVSPRRGRIVMKDYPELMAQSPRTDSSPPQTLQRVEIEATILQSRHVPGASPRAFRQALTVAGQGACTRCGEVHIGAINKVGHSSEGWVDLGDGLSTGVCLMTPELVTSKLKQLASTSVTLMPRVQVLDRQLAVIGLTELQGFHRQPSRSDAGNSSESLIGDNLQLSLRPTVVENGQIQLDLHPQSPAGEFNASLIVPPDSCVVVGGLFFELDRSSESAAHPPSWVKPPEGNQLPSKDLYEVVALIRVRVLSGHATAERPALPVSALSGPLLLTE